MPEFLTREWIAALDAAARHADLTIATDAPLVVGQEVRDSPHGDVTYHVVIDRGGARVVEGKHPAAIVTLVSDYPTALAIHRNELNAQHALSAGRVKVRGDLLALVQHADVLREVDDVFVGLRAATTYAP